MLVDQHWVEHADATATRFVAQWSCPFEWFTCSTWKSDKLESCWFGKEVGINRFEARWFEGAESWVCSGLNGRHRIAAKVFSTSWDSCHREDNTQQDFEVKLEQTSWFYSTLFRIAGSQQCKRAGPSYNWSWDSPSGCSDTHKLQALHGVAGEAMVSMLSLLKLSPILMLGVWGEM